MNNLNNKECTFNFDGDDNIIKYHTPTIKIINKNFLNELLSSGLWISNENLTICGWRKDCKQECSVCCDDHFVNTMPHVIETNNGTVYGKGIINPRFLIIKQSELLKLDYKTVSYLGYWVKGDGDQKDDEGNKAFKCVRRYLLLFLDENNYPLHKVPIRCTVKGTFMVDFDKQFRNFKKEMTIAYDSRGGCTRSDLWYAMCVLYQSLLLKK